MRTAILVSLVIALSSIVSLADANSDGRIALLKQEADKILARGPIPARDDVGIVFELADTLREKGDIQGAIKYYEAGLRVDAWSLQNQLSYSEVLMQAGQTDLGKERAEIVAQYAETDDLVVPALKLLGRDKEADLRLPKIKKLSGNKKTLVLVPMGKVDAILLREIAAAIRAEAGVPVVIQDAGINQLPPSDRSEWTRVCDSLYENLEENAGDPSLLEKLDNEGVTLAELKKDRAKLIAFYRSIMSSDAKGLDEFDRYCEKLQQIPPQWNAEKLVNLLKSKAAPYARPNVLYLGVTAADIYGDNTNFLFGLRIGERAVMSYGRFTAAFNNELPRRQRLKERALKQCLASLGHMLGLPRCSNPICARTYPNSLSEHDAKSPNLCPECKRRFQKALGTATTKPAKE